ncbi:carbon-nitrogen hydrolase family protein [Nocardioides panacis]|uniref:Carbon-nitrogen hydrolase family protein n=1 Tax=Nocardioides panacis TaxID=2849501 RepID=A0A975XYY9_9ACTN|nr:carbon-nitrogen hydrolase family protein [Nocardioides panacis]QWZ06891.1 carbon-nitrogen hydrolase family protein [Nocardioides panacis]
MTRAPGRLRLAAGQAVSVPGDLATNVATAVSLVRDAADQGARVVVLPELFLTGYDEAAWTHDASLDLDDAALEPLSEVARSRSVVVVVGAAVRRAVDPATGSGRHASTLSVLVVDPEGEVTAPYDKQHLSGPERDFFTPGDHGATIVVDGWELALGVCYDGCFPEHALAATAGGAAAYLVPAAYYVGAEHRRDVYYAARALDNGIYVAFAGLTGTCGTGSFSGGTAVYDPEGRPVRRLGLEPGVVVADLDADEVARVQREHPMATDRRDSLGPRTRVVLAG